MLVKLIDYLRDRLTMVIRLCYVVLGLLVVFDVTFVAKHAAHLWFEKLPGWWSIFGFIACVLIIIVSKWYGHVRWFGSDFQIMSPEDYYDD